MAINKNMQANNYRLAARLIRVLLSMKVQDAAALEEKLVTCESNGFKSSLPTAPCLGCGSLTDSSDVKCSFCGQRYQFCFKVRGYVDIIAVLRYNHQCDLKMT
jgi:hypothetical protein